MSMMSRVFRAIPWGLMCLVALLAASFGYGHYLGRAAGFREGSAAMKTAILEVIREIGDVPEEPRP